MTNFDLRAHARALLDANQYLTLGTICADGRPWTSPVYFAACRRAGVLLDLRDRRRALTQLGRTPLPGNCRGPMGPVPPRAQPAVPTARPRARPSRTRRPHAVALVHAGVGAHCPAVVTLISIQVTRRREHSVQACADASDRQRATGCLGAIPALIPPTARSRCVADTWRSGLMPGTSGQNLHVAPCDVGALERRRRSVSDKSFGL